MQEMGSLTTLREIYSGRLIDGRPAVARLAIARRFAVVLATMSVALVLASAPAFARTFHVPGDFPTIQAALDAANHADTVLVDPGTYRENLDFHGKDIRLESTA